MTPVIIVDGPEEEFVLPGDVFPVCKKFAREGYVPQVVLPQADGRIQLIFYRFLSR